MQRNAVEDGELEQRPIQGNWWYASHERVSGQRPSFKADVYSLAMVLWEILFAVSLGALGDGLLSAFERSEDLERQCKVLGTYLKLFGMVASSYTEVTRV